MNHNKAIVILRGTNDGDNLAPEHLALVEAQVNGYLTSAGVEAFERLYADVVAGDYQQPWLHGVQHLTRDHHGYVYWKGREVEHFTYYDEGSYHRLRNQAISLGLRCRLLEQWDVPVSTSSVVWYWEDIQAQHQCGA